ncbi:hypothetical protein GO755_40435 [Spirosoma sp. HMF4905]|uniref:Uncharacterized protein n=1 Tax=Spirosoma arboris TaxID=2682092 RepID=A0A7K1SRC3_9BACT|nr:hypothetical protein [Spirosoma arboris]MVM36341.1 hypothetical protein [Spirosoma arboris]
MNPIFSAGDRVSVANMVKGFLRSRSEAVVLGWTSYGRLTIKLDESGVVKTVAPTRVRKLGHELTPPPAA